MTAKARASLLAAAAAGILFIAPRAFAAVPAEWKIEVVDDSGPGKFSSMKADKDGNVHLAYTNTATGLLRYSFWDQRIRRWFTMSVAKGAGTCSLALDSKGRPHISYVDAGSASGSTVHHAFWDGKVWESVKVPLNSEIVAYYTSIALDANDYPSISFYEYRGPRGTNISIRLRVVSWNGRNWEVKTVDQEEGSGKFNCIASDSTGRMHVGYANVSEGSARYAYWDGKTWVREIFDGPQQNNGAYVGYSACIAFDREGTPHMTYANQSLGFVKYAVRKGGRWQIETIDSVGGVAYPDRNSLVIDQNGNPYIGYFDAARGLLKVAFREGKQWAVTEVDSDGTGFTSSLQIVDGTLWVSYADETQGALKVARIDLQSLRQPVREGK